LSRPSEDKYPERVVETIVQAFYSRATASPDAARARAQSAYGIASAVAGGLVGGALIADLAALPRWLHVLGAAALAAWLVTTSLYVFAVAVPVNLLVENDVRGSNAFIDAVVINAVNERERIDKRQKRANIAAALAMVLTAATFTLGLFWSPRESTFRGVVHFNQTFQLACGGVRSIAGLVYEDSVTEEMLQIRPHQRMCEKQSEILYFPRSQVSRIEREG
jgi:MFS family permease